MSRERKTLLRRYCIGAGAGLLITALCLYIQDFSFTLPRVECFRILSNAFTVTGTLLLGLGALVWISNQEFFFGLFYGLGHAVRMLIPGRKKKDMKYYDYVEEQRAKGKVHGYGFLPMCGAVFMAMAVLFLLLFNSAE